MRVLHVYKTYYPQTYGGVEQVIQSICHYLKAKNIVCDILICGVNNSNYLFKHCNVRSLKTDLVISNNALSLKMVYNFVSIQKEYDIIHFHYPYMMNEFLYFLKKIKKPYVVTYHSDVCRSNFISTLYKYFSYKFLKDSQKVIYTSPNYIDISYTKDFELKKAVVPLTISGDILKLDQIMVSKQVKRIGSNYILFLGALRRYKGLETLLQAASLSNKKFIIAGSGESQEKLIELKNDLGLDNLVFLGKVNDQEKNYLIKNCKALVLPSDKISEAFGVVLLEAFIHKKCAITSDLPTGMAYVNQHDKTGRVFQKGNPTDLKNQIDFIFDNRLTYERYCENAERSVQNNFSPSILEKYFQIYSSIVENRKL